MCLTSPWIFTYSPWPRVNGNNWEGNGQLLLAHHCQIIFYTIYSFLPSEPHSNNKKQGFRTNAPHSSSANHCPGVGLPSSTKLLSVRLFLKPIAGHLRPKRSQRSKCPLRGQVSSSPQEAHKDRSKSLPGPCTPGHLLWFMFTSRNCLCWFSHYFKLYPKIASDMLSSAQKPIKTQQEVNWLYYSSLYVWSFKKGKRRAWGWNLWQSLGRS